MAKTNNYFLTRRNKLRRTLRKNELDGLLVSHVANVTYLTGFTGDSSYLLVTRSNDLILSDSRYTTQLDEECPGLDRTIRGPAMNIVEATVKVLKKSKLATLGVEGASMTVAAWEMLERELRSTSLKMTTASVEELRQIKDKEEIAAIRRAVRQAEKVFTIVRATLRGDQTEKQVADDLEYRLRQIGAKETSFPPIVAVGARAALPHAQPSQVRIDAAGMVLIDWGADEGLYKSDLTRVLVTGRIPPKLKTVYGVVLTAQRQAIEAIHPGAMCEDVDWAARRVIQKAGFGRRFGHALGHGVGLEIHEAPRIGPKQKQRLEPGMVVTVEPGIYLPGRFGVRIEDDVLVTKDGCEVLSKVPKEFNDAMVS